MPERPEVPSSLVIAVDTNAFYGDLELTNHEWSGLLSRCRRGDVRLWIPEVVVREVVRLHARKLAAALKDMRDGLNGVRSLRLDVGLLPDRRALERAVREKAEGYEERLRAVLRDAGASFLPLPTVCHETLLERALNEAKPFRLKARDPENKGPDGYRDALIWFSIAESASSLTRSEQLIFVSNNHQDFCDGGKGDESVSSTLLSDLPNDLRIRRCATLKQALELPELKTEYVITPTLEAESSLRDDILSWVENACEKSLPGANISNPDYEQSSGYTFDGLSLPAVLEEPTIEHIEVDGSTLDWSVYETYEEGTQLASVTVEAEVQIDGFANKWDDLDGLEMHDSDWNDHMVWAYTSRPARLIFNATLDPHAGVTDLTFEGGEAL